MEKPKLKTGAQGTREEGEAPEAKPGETTGELDLNTKERVVEMWGPESHVEAKETKEASEALHAETERKEQEQQPGAVQKSKAQPQQAPPKVAQQQKKDGFEGGLLARAAAAQAAGSLSGKFAVGSKAAVAATTALTTPALPGSDRPQDAFKLLHGAKEPGVFFKERGAHAGGEQEEEDQELAAAVEETIRILFGVRGIHRVVPGRDEANEPVIIVAAGMGFGEASLKQIPERVQRFPTLLALPYEMLPLRRER